jgi:hypothetical protein
MLLQHTYIPAPHLAGPCRQKLGALGFPCLPGRFLPTRIPLRQDSRPCGRRCGIDALVHQRRTRHLHGKIRHFREIGHRDNLILFGFGELLADGSVAPFAPIAIGLPPTPEPSWTELNRLAGFEQPGARFNRDVQCPVPRCSSVGGGENPTLISQTPPWTGSGMRDLIGSVGW